jgi:hypothetical protein
LSLQNATARVRFGRRFSPRAFARTLDESVAETKPVNVYAASRNAAI